MPSPLRARIFARARPVDGKLPRMPTSFAKLLEPKFSHFAKIERMPISFGKLLEMLLGTNSGRQKFVFLENQLGRFVFLEPSALFQENKAQTVTI
jgi:hypothetical protein